MIKFLDAFAFTRGAEFVIWDFNICGWKLVIGDRFCGRLADRFMGIFEGSFDGLLVRLDCWFVDRFMDRFMGRFLGWFDRFMSRLEGWLMGRFVKLVGRFVRLVGRFVRLLCIFDGFGGNFTFVGRVGNFLPGLVRTTGLTYKI